MGNQYPTPGGLDNFYSIVKRHEKDVERCFTDLNNEEQLSYLAKPDEDELGTFCQQLSVTIRTLAEFFHISYLGVASFLSYVVFMRFLAVFVFFFNATPKSETGA